MNSSLVWSGFHEQLLPPRYNIEKFSQCVRWFSYHNYSASYTESVYCTIKTLPIAQDPSGTLDESQVRFPINHNHCDIYCGPLSEVRFQSHRKTWASFPLGFHWKWIPSENIVLWTSFCDNSEQINGIWKIFSLNERTVIESELR